MAVTGWLSGQGRPLGGSDIEQVPSPSPPPQPCLLSCPEGLGTSHMACSLGSHICKQCPGYASSSKILGEGHRLVSSLLPLALYIYLQGWGTFAAGREQPCLVKMHLLERG